MAIRTVKPVTYSKQIDKVMSNLNREVKKIKNASLKGLLKATIIVRRDMDKTPPKIPVDTNNLRASWRVFPYKSPKGPYVVMGFTANYALFVHEMLDKDNKKINWTRPESGPRFFSEALKRNKLKMLEAIMNETKFK